MRAMAWLWCVTVAAAVAWFPLHAGEEAPRKDVPPDPKPKPKLNYEPLPAEIVGFRGHFTGTLVSSDDKGLVLKIAGVQPEAASKAPQPAALVGREMRMLFIAFSSKNGHYSPDQELVKAAGSLAPGGVVTVRARTDRDEAIIIDQIQPGAVDAGKPDPAPKPPPAPDPPAKKTDARDP